MINVCLAIKHLHNFLNVLISERVVIGFLFEQPAGVDELGGHIGFVFGQHQNIDGDGGAKKQVRREWNHGFDVVVVHQILANFLLGAPVKNAGKANYGCTPFAGKVTECMQHKGKISFGFGR